MLCCNDSVVFRVMDDGVKQGAIENWTSSRWAPALQMLYSQFGTAHHVERVYSDMGRYLERRWTGDIAGVVD